MMQNLYRCVVVLGSLIASVMFGAVFYAIIERGRAILFCPAGLREGSDCYSSGWVWVSPVSVGSTGFMVAAFYILFVSFLLPKKSVSQMRTTFIIGAAAAIPFCVILDSVWIYLVTLLGGVLAYVADENF